MRVLQIASLFLSLLLYAGGTSPTATAPTVEVQVPLTLLTIDVSTSGPVLGRWKQLPDLFYEGAGGTSLMLSPIPLIADEGFQVDVNVLAGCTDAKGEVDCQVIATWVTTFRDRVGKVHEISRDMAAQKFDAKEGAWIYASKLAETLPHAFAQTINKRWHEYLTWRDWSDANWRFRIQTSTGTLGSEA